MSAKNDNKARPLVSVVIPCFNQAHYLPDAIKVVQSQLVKPIQITIVDDGSTDDTEKVSGPIASNISGISGKQQKRAM